MSENSYIECRSLPAHGRFVLAKEMTVMMVLGPSGSIVITVIIVTEKISDQLCININHRSN